MTITESIIAAHARLDEVRAGQFVFADVDMCLGNDVTAPIAIQEFEAAGLKRVFDAGRIALIPDHFTPNKDIKSAEQCKLMREFARRHDLRHYYEVGRCGIEHAFLPEQGIVVSGDLVIGADSHTCTYGGLGAFAAGVGSTDLAACMALGKVWLRVPESMLFTLEGKLPRWVGGKDLILFTIGKIGVDGARYRAMEFTGSAILSLEVEERLTVCNMAIEAGAKNGIVAPDKKALAYCRSRSGKEPVAYTSDEDASYVERLSFDVSGLSPMVALPHLPSNVVPVEEVPEVVLDQVVIGSCTNGRIADMRTAAHILRGKKAAGDVRLIVIPATRRVYSQALEEGLIETFLEAEAVVSPPTCGPCLGGHMGVLAAGERALATTNRNFVGRMGHPKSEVYLCGPAVAAASAVAGRIVHPDEVAATEMEGEAV